MSVYRKGERWAVRVDLERDTKGPRKRKSYGSFRTKKEAEAKEREILNKRASGLDLSSQSMTVDELIDKYIENCETRGISIKTVDCYKELKRLQVTAHIGHLTLAKLKRSHITDLIATLSKTGNTRNGKGLAPKTIKHVVCLVATALEWAIGQEIIDRNPASHVTLPKIPKRTAKAIEGEEARKLLDAAEAEGSLWGRLFTVSLTVGARRGEVAALKWSDIDEKVGTVTISRALSQTVSAGTIVKSTKTDSVRIVKLSPMAKAAFKAQRAAQAAEKLKAEDYHDEGWVFANPIGEALNPVSISNAFCRIATNAGISTTRLHDMRHTFASWLIASGENIETVKDALGHSTSYTTLTTYAHVVKKATAASVDRIDERLAKPHGHQMATPERLAG